MWARFFGLARPSRGGLNQLGWFHVDSLARNEIIGFRPWWVYGAIDLVEHWLDPSSSVLELGSGGSTLFWAERGNPVTSIENSASWLKKVADATAQYKDVNLVFGDYPEAVARLGVSRPFDVLVIDHFTDGSRSDVLKHCLPLLTNEAVIIWDNSDRQDSESGRNELLRLGYKEIAFFGLSPGNAYCSQTSIFSRAFPQRSWSVSQKKTIDY